MALVAFSAVSKRYSSRFRPAHRLSELLWPSSRRRDGFWALRDVSLAARDGEVLCLVGANGSGKTTSLQIAAGILRPTSGSARVEGRIAALLDLGAGFHPEFTGRENAFLSAALQGLSRSQTRRRLPGIEAFAEIGAFMDRPVKTYSSGMLLRLAFAVATSVEPDVLLVDEALAVGDYYFRQRCMRRVHRLRRGGAAIVFVSHSMADVQALGTRVVWLDGGRVASSGEPRDIVRRYLAEMKARDRSSRGSQGPAPPPASPAPAAGAKLRGDARFGSGRARITGISLLDSDGRPARQLAANSRFTVRISVKALESIAAPNIGFMMRNHLGLDFAGTNTAREGVSLRPLAAGESLTVDFRILVPELYAGSFSFAPAVSDGSLDDYEICDWIENALAVPMARGAGEVYGYLHLPCSVEVISRRASRAGHPPAGA